MSIKNEYANPFPQGTQDHKEVKSMDKYEILYIIRCDVEEDRRAATIEKFETLTTNLGGVVDSLDKMGMKKFAYEINKQNEGYYVFMCVTCSSETVAEVNRQMRNDEAVLRQMIIKK